MEQEIYRLLERSPGIPHSIKEVGKRVDRDRFREEPGWARVHLKALVEQGLVEENMNGLFLVSRKR